MEKKDLNYLVAQFLQAWINWVDSGAISNRFCRSDGLCHAIIDWQTERKTLGIQPALTWDDECALDEHLSRLFRKSGLSGVNPFGHDNYFHRRGRETQHECPERLEWVRTTLEELSHE